MSAEEGLVDYVYHQGLLGKPESNKSLQVFKDGYKRKTQSGSKPSVYTVDGRYQ